MIFNKNKKSANSKTHTRRFISKLFQSQQQQRERMSSASATSSEIVQKIQEPYVARPAPRCVITGPQWVGPNYCNTFYVPRIDAALDSDPNLELFLGDADGADQNSLKHLAARGAFDRVTVYVKKGKEARCDKRFKVNATSTSFPARDILMAESATSIIAVLPQFGRLTTGANLPVFKVHTGPNLVELPAEVATEKQDVNPLGAAAWMADASHVGVLLQNRSMEISPVFWDQANAGASSALRDALLAQKIQQILRAYSEPEDKALTSVVGLLYEMWYAPTDANTDELQKEFLALLRAKLHPVPQNEEDAMM